MAKVTTEGVEVLRALCGSRAYGLHNEKSDYDYHSVYVVSTRRLLSIGSEIKASVRIEGDEDSHAWELRHFLELAMKGNPTILETFVAPKIEIPRVHISGSDYDNIYIGKMLKRVFPLVLSKRAIYDSFRGYASSQVHLFKKEGSDRRKLKAALAYLRTMYHGSQLLGYGTYDTEIDPAYRITLMQFKEAEVFTDDLMAKFNYLSEIAEESITLAYNNSPLPEQANLEEVNNFLINIRRNCWLV